MCCMNQTSAWSLAVRSPALEVVQPAANTATSSHQPSRPRTSHLSPPLPAPHLFKVCRHAAPVLDRPPRRRSEPSSVLAGAGSEASSGRGF
jgi:hypothetical protein